MSYGISLHVWGEYACFTRPELKGERMSYEVMTPSAARGILSAIYWKPEFEWVVDRIHVLKPIRFMQIRRNELEKRVLAPSTSVMCGKQTSNVGLMIEDNRQQRATMLLKDVGYVIDAHVNVLHEIEGVNSVAKHLEIFKRRASMGQCFHQPCFGCREFPAMFELIDKEHPMPSCELPETQRNRAFGLMLHDIVYTPDKKGKIICGHTRKKLSANPHFFIAELQNGVLSVPSLNNSLS